MASSSSSSTAASDYTRSRLGGVNKPSSQYTPTPAGSQGGVTSSRVIENPDGSRTTIDTYGGGRVEVTETDASGKSSTEAYRGEKGITADRVSIPDRGIAAQNSQFTSETVHFTKQQYGEVPTGRTTEYQQGLFSEENLITGESQFYQRQPQQPKALSSVFSPSALEANRTSFEGSPSSPTYQQRFVPVDNRGYYDVMGKQSVFSRGGVMSGTVEQMNLENAFAARPVYETVEIPTRSGAEYNLLGPTAAQKLLFEPEPKGQPLNVGTFEKFTYSKVGIPAQSFLFDVKKTYDVSGAWLEKGFGYIDPMVSASQKGLGPKDYGMFGQRAIGPVTYNLFKESVMTTYKNPLLIPASYIGGTVFGSVFKSGVASSLSFIRKNTKGIALTLGIGYGAEVGTRAIMSGSPGGFGAVIGKEVPGFYGFTKGFKGSKQVGEYNPIKFSKAVMPTLDGTKNVWRGVSVEYLGKGKPLIGWSEGRIKLGTPNIKTRIDITQIRSGNDYPYTQTPTQTAIFRGIVSKEVSPVDLRRFDLALGIARKTRNTKSKFIQSKYPTDVKYLEPKLVEETFNIAKEEGATIYGSLAQSAQLPKGKSRLPADIDIQFNIGQDMLPKKAEMILGRFKSLNPKSEYFIDPSRPTLIQVKMNGETAHALDIHAIDYSGAGTNLNRVYGLSIDQGTININGIKSMKLSEQSIRKGPHSILAPKGYRLKTNEELNGIKFDELQKVAFAEGKGFAPEKHRLKDVYDFFDIQEFGLIPSKKIGRNKLYSELAELKSLYPSDSARKQLIYTPMPAQSKISISRIRPPNYLLISKSDINYNPKYEIISSYKTSVYNSYQTKNKSLINLISSPRIIRYTSKIFNYNTQSMINIRSISPSTNNLSSSSSINYTSLFSISITSPPVKNQSVNITTHNIVSSPNFKISKSRTALLKNQNYLFDDNKKREIFKLGFNLKKDKKKRVKYKFTLNFGSKYSPSLTAKPFKSYSFRVPKRLTGLEVRPIIR